MDKGASPYDEGYILHYDEGDYSLEKDIPALIRTPDDKVHTLLEDETLHSLSFRYYGDSGRWYVIAEANGIMNPFKELKPGMKLIIPAYGLIE